MNKIVSYFKEVWVELAKITWPKKEEIIKLTLVVLVFSGLVAVFVGLLDYIFTKFLELLITL